MAYARRARSRGSAVRCLLALSSGCLVLGPALPAVASPPEDRRPGHPRSAVAAIQPGPEILHAAPAPAPQLENAGSWLASPILVAGASAYRNGEFLYQDFLYDDLGASSAYTYPAAPAYAGNAADFVEIRLKPLADSTAIRLTFNSMLDPALVGTTIVLGSSASAREFPHGANTRAPAEVFVTVHGTTADAIDAATGQPAAGPGPTASVDITRRQVEVRVPYTAYDPRGRSAVRIAAATGLWDSSANRYSIPPGGGPSSTAFYNAGFRYGEPLGGGVVGMRESQQSSVLASGDLSPFFAEVDFTKLAAGITDELAGQRTGVPVTGFMNRIFASHFETRQGRGDATSLQTQNCPQECAPARAGRLQSYSIYVPSKPLPAAGYGLTLMLHSSGGTANQYQGSQGAIQLGERGSGSIVITPEARGPSYFYYGQAAADVFESCADAARLYRLDPDNSVVVGTSMGGYGSYKLATTYPDLFAAAVPVVPCPSAGVMYVPGGPVPGGEASAIVRVASSLRHVPSFSLQSANDPICSYYGEVGAASIFQRLDALNYQYEAWTFHGTEHALVGNLLPYNPGPIVDFVSRYRRAPEPAHVSYVLNDDMSQPEVSLTADHAYWLSGLSLRDTTRPLPVGGVEAFSFGFGVSDPAATSTDAGTGLYPGVLYPFQYQRKMPAAGAVQPVQNRLDLSLTNVSAVTIDPVRARVSCDSVVNVTTDGPVTVSLAGCARTIHSG
jgi:pimeloyl-ACP methyl ester carboxylesterase